MTRDTNSPTSATPSSSKDEQDQVFGREAEKRKQATEADRDNPVAGEDRPSEPHAGGKA